MTHKHQRLDIAVSNLAELHRLGAAVGKGLSEGIGIGLKGPLGVGKTEFVRAVAKEFGIADEVASPTFVLEHLYPLPQHSPCRAISHWDLYRLSPSTGENELAEVLADPAVITFVEWPERVPWVEALLTCSIVFEFVEANDSARRISFHGALPVGVTEELKEPASKPG